MGWDVGGWVFAWLGGDWYGCVCMRWGCARMGGLEFKRGCWGQVLRVVGGRWVGVWGMGWWFKGDVGECKLYHILVIDMCIIH